MSKRAIQSIIFFMSISLVGLIAFQAYWITHSVKQEAQNFDRDMQQLLSDISTDITKQQAKLLVKKAAVREPIVLENSGNSDIRVIIQEAKKVGRIPTDAENKTIVVNTTNGSTTVTTVNTYGNTFSSKISEGMIEKYVSQKNILTEVVDEMAYEFAFEDVDLSHQLKNIAIDSMVSSKLSAAGFQDIKYAFKIKDYSLDSIIKAGGLLADDSKNVLYATNLSDNGEMNLSVNNKTLLILKSLWLTLALSIVLTTLLIGTFIYTINSILKQKRISTMKADFINNMTHEFKTPVATISLAIDSILHKDVKGKPKEIEKFGAIIKKENQRMNQQIESLLGIALFNKESFQLNKETIDVHELLVELKENFEIKSTSQAGDIALFLEANSSHIMADRMHFYNVLRNIIDNGIKFSSQEFRIRVRTLVSNKQLIISISDQGIGMSRDTQNKIFDRFYRKTEGDIHTTKGFGLGLAYVKEVLSKMGGEISVESTLDKGSTFTLKIDLV